MPDPQRVKLSPGLVYVVPILDGEMDNLRTLIVDKLSAIETRNQEILTIQNRIREDNLEVVSLNSQLIGRYIYLNNGTFPPTA
jgi:hypothetical protein